MGGVGVEGPMLAIPTALRINSGRKSLQILGALINEQHDIGLRVERIDHNFRLRKQRSGDLQLTM